MSETRTITVYPYTELQDAARERARGTVSQWLMEWRNEGLQDLFSRELLEYGFPTDKIEWSLGYCQGDGVAFYGDVDVDAYMKKRAELGKPVDEFSALRTEEMSLHVTIERNSYGNHYSHWNTMDTSVTVYEDLPEDADGLTMAERFEDIISEDVRNVSRSLERMGYAELEIEEDEIAEYCDDNEIRFLASGVIAPEGN